MPPRDQYFSEFGERSRLMTDPNEEDAEGIALPQQQPVGFWEAVKSRRERSDLEAANDSSALVRRQRNKWIAILWGQAIALIIASVNITSFVLENKYHVVAPLFLMFFMYIFLSIHLCFCSSEYRSTDPEYYLPLTNLRLRIPWYIYLAMSSIDVGAGVIMLLSLQYTSLTSVTLLSSLTLPSTMVFCKIFLNKNFHAHHFLGVILCGFGGLLTIWADLEARKTSEDDSEDVVHELFSMNIGDLYGIDELPTRKMAITAAVLYGLGDAVSEFSVKHIDRMELLGMLGLFGMILTGLLFPIRDYSALQTLFADLAYNVMPLFLIICYVCLLLLYYITEASFFVASDATLLNLSLQAQNLWAILFSVVTYQSAPPLLFYVALMLVFVGVFVYEGMSTVGILGLTATADAVVSRENNIELEGSEGALVSTTDQGGEDDSNQRVRSQGNKKYNSIQQSELV